MICVVQKRKVYPIFETWIMISGGAVHGGAAREHGVRSEVRCSRDMDGPRSRLYITVAE